MGLIRQVRALNAERAKLSCTQRAELKASRMFAPVVSVLFLSTLEPMCHYVAVIIYQVYYRELVLGFVLSIAFNSAVNLIIYYSRGDLFRQELRSTIFSKFCKA